MITSSFTKTFQFPNLWLGFLFCVRCRRKEQSDLASHFVACSTLYFLSHPVYRIHFAFYYHLQNSSPQIPLIHRYHNQLPGPVTTLSDQTHPAAPQQVLTAHTLPVLLVILQSVDAEQGVKSEHAAFWPQNPMF